MPFDADLIAAVQAATDIEALISQYVVLEPMKHSGCLHGICPFCHEKAFVLRPDRKMYYCFGCQRGGDAIRFVVEKDGVGFFEAVHRLAKRAGIEVRPL